MLHLYQYKNEMEHWQTLIYSTIVKNVDPVDECFYFIGSPILGTVIATAGGAKYCGPITVLPPREIPTKAGTTCPNIPPPVSTNERKRTSSSSSSLNRSIQALICSKSLSGSIVVVAMSLATKKWKQRILICSRNERYSTTPSLTKKHYRLYYRSINKLQLVVEHCSTVSCRRAAVCMALLGD